MTTVLELAVDQIQNPDEQSASVEGSPVVVSGSVSSDEGQADPPAHNPAQHCNSCTCHLPNNEDPNPNPQIIAAAANVPQVNSSERWYTVSKGRNIGVFRDWSVFFRPADLTTCSFFLFRHTVLPLVSGVSGACFQRHTSRAAAEAAFTAAVQSGDVAFIVA
jgi:hypothetical protein